jgi:hypothetical protein
VGYFADKEQKRKDSVEIKKREMKTDKRIILELQRQIKALNIENKKIKNQLDFTKERLLKEGGQACCC